MKDSLSVVVGTRKHDISGLTHTVKFGASIEPRVFETKKQKDLIVRRTT